MIFYYKLQVPHAVKKVSSSAAHARQVLELQQKNKSYQLLSDDDDDDDEAVTSKPRKVCI